MALKLDLISRKFDLFSPSYAETPKRMSNIFNTPAGRSSPSDPLDWTHQFNQSLDEPPNCDNSDLYPLLASFEKNTWASLDCLKNKIIENNELIHEVQSSISSTFQQISQVANSNAPQASATRDSPLINAINSDMSSEIREKCDQIEIKINYLTENLSKINIQTSTTASNPSSIEEYTDK